MNEGKWVVNECIGKCCLIVINVDLIYNVENGEFFFVIICCSFWKVVIVELLGYICGYSNVVDFCVLGIKFWDVNVNENIVWFNNLYWKGEDDMGLVYGVIGCNFLKFNGGFVDLFC